MNPVEDSVREVFRALTLASLTPVAPRLLVEATAVALAKAGADRSSPLDAPDDAGAAQRWICERVASLADPYPVLRDLARAANDPHTFLFTARAGLAMMAIVSGAPSTDPGMAFQRLADGSLVVAEVVAGSAASACDLRAGDVICSVAGERPARGMDVVAAILDAAEGSTVSFEVERRGERKTVALGIEPATLPLVARHLIEPAIGYVRLRWITTAQDPERDSSMLLRRALEELNREGARAIVLDLRGNQGGYGLTRVASLLTCGDPIVIYGHPSGEEEIATRIGERSPVVLPLAVLVDEETNSAAEMIAFALQQHGDACIVGRPTAGGLNVPLQKPIGDSHVLMVPGSKVHGPRTRTSTAGMRVIPDVIAPSRTIQDLVQGSDPELAVACRQVGRARP